MNATCCISRQRRLASRKSDIWADEDEVMLVATKQIAGINAATLQVSEGIERDGHIGEGEYERAEQAVSGNPP
jgi:hypothetical protein